MGSRALHLIDPDGSQGFHVRPIDAIESGEAVRGKIAGIGQPVLRLLVGAEKPFVRHLTERGCGEDEDEKNVLHRSPLKLTR